MTERNLIRATRQGNIALVKQLIADGVDINEQDKKKMTALMHAINGSKTFLFFRNQSCVEIANLLINAGADTDIKDKYGRSALVFAEYNATSELIALIEQRSNKKHKRDFDMSETNVAHNDEKEIAPDISQGKSKMSGWWGWTIFAVLWVTSAMGQIVFAVSSGVRLHAILMLPGAIIILLRFFGPPPTFGRALLLGIGCFLTISPMVHYIYGMAFDSTEIGCTIFAIIFMLLGFKRKMS